MVRDDMEQFQTTVAANLGLERTRTRPHDIDEDSRPNKKQHIDAGAPVVTPNVDATHPENDTTAPSQQIKLSKIRVITHGDRLVSEMGDNNGRWWTTTLLLTNGLWNNVLKCIKKHKQTLGPIDPAILTLVYEEFDDDRVYAGIVTEIHSHNDLLIVFDDKDTDNVTREGYDQLDRGMVLVKFVTNNTEREYLGEITSVNPSLDEPFQVTFTDGEKRRYNRLDIKHAFINLQPTPSLHDNISVIQF
jgi:hypothetical protein